MLAQTDIFPISQLNSWAKEWRRRIRMFSIEWTHTQNQFTLTHERAYKQLILMRNFGCLLSIHHSLYHFNYVQGSFIHFKSFVFLSRARVCVNVCFVCSNDAFFLSFSSYFWQKKKSFGMLAVCRKWVYCLMLMLMLMFMFDALVHVYVCGWCFFPECFFRTYQNERIFIPFS